MHHIETEIEIEAPAERVWDILLDFPAHPEWNPFVRTIKGQAEPGERLTVSVQPGGGKGMTFTPTVLVVTPNRELRWRGRFLLPGIFDGEHYFEIIPRTPGQVRFIHGERFSGILVPLMKSWLDKGTRAGFMAMNKALKSRAERSSTAIV